MKKKSAKMPSKSKKDQLIVLRIPEDISVEDFKLIKKYCKNHKITVNKFFDDAVDEMLETLNGITIKEARKLVDNWKEDKVK